VVPGAPGTTAVRARLSPPPVCRVLNARASPISQEGKNCNKKMLESGGRLDVPEQLRDECARLPLHHVLPCPRPHRLRVHYAL